MRLQESTSEADRTGHKCDRIPQHISMYEIFGWDAWGVGRILNQIFRWDARGVGRVLHHNFWWDDRRYP